MVILFRAWAMQAIGFMERGNAGDDFKQTTTGRSIEKNDVREMMNEENDERRSNETYLASSDRSPVVIAAKTAC